MPAMVTLQNLENVLIPQAKDVLQELMAVPTVAPEIHAPRPRTGCVRGSRARTPRDLVDRLRRWQRSGHPQDGAIGLDADPPAGRYIFA